jgi:methionyl-tRNA formyltransferase
MKKGSQLVLKTVKAIAAGNYPSVPQPAGIEIKHAPKIFKETCQINWSQSTTQVINFVRGLSPSPAAWTSLNGKVYKIFKVQNSKFEIQNSAIGEFKTDNKTYLYIKTSDGWVSITEFQPEGKKRMTVEEFFRGNKI